MANDVVLRFDTVSFEYGHNIPILDGVDFSVRRGSKITIMGQNGAGKSTIFSLITGAQKPESGSISITRGQTIAIARQVIPRSEIELTVREFFEKCFKEKMYDIDPRIDAVLEVVNLKAPHDRIVKSYSAWNCKRRISSASVPPASWRLRTGVEESVT
jgi:ABC-type multidrug transport system ATPase subunit